MENKISNQDLSTLNNWPQFALSFEEIKSMSDEEVINRIQIAHSISEDEIFKESAFYLDTKFSRSLMTRVTLFRLEGVSWHNIVKYLDYFFQNVDTDNDDAGKTDLYSIVQVRFAAVVSLKTKIIIKNNEKNFLFRITTLFHEGEKNRLRSVLSSLMDAYFTKTGSRCSLQDVFIKIPTRKQVDQTFDFLQICEFMFLKTCLELSVNYGYDRRLVYLANLSTGNIKKLQVLIVRYFSEDFRRVFLTYNHIPK
jgi:hypothetical protein